MTKKSEQKYTMLPNMGVYDDRTGEVYNRNTLTDEVAEYLLSKDKYKDRILTVELSESLGNPNYPEFLRHLYQVQVEKDAQKALEELREKEKKVKKNVKSESKK